MFYDSALVEYVHFVPVSQRHLERDVCAKLAWLRANPDIAERIAANGARWAREFFIAEMPDLYIAETLRQYAALYRPDPPVPPETERLCERARIDLLTCSVPSGCNPFPRKSAEKLVGRCRFKLPPEPDVVKPLIVRPVRVRTSMTRKLPP